MATPIQSKLGIFKLPPTPKPANTLTDYQQAVSVWTRQAEQQFKQLRDTFISLDTTQIPEAPGGGVFFTDALARAAVSATSPLLYDVTTGIFSIQNAAADGATKGAAAFASSDFNATSGVISIDYTNGQAADATHKGFLTAADWTTFNGKQNALPAFVSSRILYGNGTSTPVSSAGFTFDGSYTVTIGGVGVSPDSTFSALRFYDQANSSYAKFEMQDATLNLTVGLLNILGGLTVQDDAVLKAAVRFTAIPSSLLYTDGSGFVGSTTVSSPLGFSSGTLSIADAAADGSTKGAAAFTAADFNATSGVVSIDYTNAQKATASVPGFLTAADWTTFNNKQPALGNFTTGRILFGQGTSIPNTASDFFWDNTNKRLGIGVAAPTFLLSFPPTLGHKLSLYDSGLDSDFHGFGVNVGVLSFRVPTSSHAFVFYNFDSSTENEVFRIYGTGDVLSIAGIRGVNIAADDGLGNISALLDGSAGLHLSNDLSGSVPAILFDAATLTASPVDGSLEFDGSIFYFTQGGTRYPFSTAVGGGFDGGGAT